MKSEYELAADVAAIIEERGLATGILEDSGGRVCTRGAMFVALVGSPYPPSYQVLRRYDDLVERFDDLVIGVANCGDRSALYAWSDSSDQDEVVRVLRTAAALAPKRELEVAVA